MSLDKAKLLDFLNEIDKEISNRITIVAVGGTAMTLLNLKPSTLDVDFTIPCEYYEEFESARKIVQPGFRIDVYKGGSVFITVLPKDYLEKSIPIITNFKSIDLRSLDPVDIIITKIARLNDRDKTDIKSCITKFNITKAQIDQRAIDINYLGNDEVFICNLNKVLVEFF